MTAKLRPAIERLEQRNPATEQGRKAHRQAQTFRRIEQEAAEINDQLGYDNDDEPTL